ncbi:hypothetical protein A4X13_0g7842 [Tilletia indica]|uniref:Uncharacterized protein n=1 Tax=Tilletia indica TaxID=43049 RepID=A0A177T8Z3_9BASI|nr:hypothetical protein A4X13_0g7842 [Tilletia indica]
MADAGPAAPEAPVVPDAEPEQPEFTPAQVELAQQLRENSTAWILEQEQHQLTRSERHGALDMAYSILLTENMGPKDALEEAIGEVLKRRRLTELMGINLCPSSPASSQHNQPEQQKKRKRTSSEKARKKKKQKKNKVKERANKSKKKSKSRRGSSKGNNSESDSSSPSSSSSESESDGESTSSDEDDSSSSSRTSTAANIGWIKGKTNPEQWDALRVPLHICKKVQKGEFVDLWWFTPATCRERHDDLPMNLAVSGNTLKRITKDRPKNFLEDVELSQSDFHWALDTWRDTMRDENVAKETVQAWDSFNTMIKSHQKRDDPDIQLVLQKLHHFQRDSFANKTRRTKNKMKAIEESDWSTKKKERELKKLKAFDPSKFPLKTFDEMIKEQRAGTVRELKALIAKSTASNSQPPLQPLNGGAQHRSQNKPFRTQTPATNGPPKANKACALCGSKQQHDVRRCRVQRLAANLQPTFAIRDDNGDLVTRAVHNGATWAPPPHHRSALLLNIDGWKEELAAANLQGRYPTIVEALLSGLDIGIQAPVRTHISKHHNSALNSPEQVELIINKELSARRYHGPHPSRKAVEDIIGPFQTAPLGLRPKPNDKYRLIQDFSYPKTLSPTQNPSVNSTLDINMWPTTWYTFTNICATILSLPRSAQAFVRDVISAFRQIPLHPSQWPGTVVEWEGKFYIDMFLAFGLGPACGAFGLFADAFADICRAHGIGPTGHWVDDNVFFRVPTEDVPALNKHRAMLRSQLQGPLTKLRGRSYWPDGHQSLHVEDYARDILILPGAEDGFNCGISDIDGVSATLGWPWEREKDAPWATVFTYGGLTFNIATREVSLPERKRQKYLNTIAQWEQGGHRRQLHDAQQLLGQLQHATTVHEKGKFHLKGLLDFVRCASTHPSRRYQLRRVGARIPKDLNWWKNQLALDAFCRSFDPQPPSDVDCFCDGSTSYGAGIHIAGRERSFPLHAHLRGTVDIKTVESLSLELAVLYLVHLGHHDTSLIVHSDSTPVCGAFKKGRMAADEANTVLERIAELEQRHRIRVCLRWVKSKENKADLPGSQPAGSQQGGEDPDPNKKHTPERTHAVDATATPVKGKLWSKLTQRWKEKNSTTAQPQSEKTKAKASKPKPGKKGPFIKSRTFKAKKNMIQTSVTTNRPQVELAAQRFASWIPATPTKVPRATRASSSTVRDVALAGYAAGTQKGYSVGLAQWHKYCDDNKIDEKLREPAPAHLVEHWVSTQAGSKSGGYLSDWISGLKAWHLLNNLPWLPDDERLTVIRRGVLNLQPPPKPPRAPMTVEWLDKLYLAADRDNPAEMAVVAAAATGFWGLCRLGELVSSTDPAQKHHNITRAQVAESIAFGSIPTLTLQLPRTKTKAQGDTVVIAHQKEECDPIKLMHLHLQQSPCATKEAEATTPLFAYRGERSMVPLTRSKFLSTIGAIGKRADIGTLQGHSMRIGGCTTLLTRGVPPDRVQLHGRWSGDAFKRYIRDHAAVMTPYLVVNQVASDRLHQLYPSEWSTAALATTNIPNGPTQTPGPDLPPRARGRQTPTRTNTKRGR